MQHHVNVPVYTTKLHATKGCWKPPKPLFQSALCYTTRLPHTPQGCNVNFKRLLDIITGLQEFKAVSCSCSCTNHDARPCALAAEREHGSHPFNFFMRERIPRKDESKYLSFRDRGSGPQTQNTICSPLLKRTWDSPLLNDSQVIEAALYSGKGRRQVSARSFDLLRINTFLTRRETHRTMIISGGACRSIDNQTFSV